ncbi:ABC transporter ATP-binding protein [Lacticaseibacillus thailandensis]|uniref:ABC transporter ATP-binding protein n=1 Tax=Lacticaseibacillus thailandensis TaxID=381741 RepID=UPI0006D22F0B|nr:ABC transporter ATP-binding protein [Lacticaseibacillus thailandensis]
MIEFKAITKRYPDSVALDNVDLRVESRELFVLVGPSGSGKTTLLKMVNRLVVPTTGQVLIDGEDVATSNVQTLRQHIGYVLQSSALFPNMTVMQNAAVQLEALGWAKDKIRDRINYLLQVVDLDPATYTGRKPDELSGGEAQRVGIVRALAGNPKLMLMDEPFSALDPVSKEQLQDLILRLHREVETTIIFVTHDMREAVRLADRLAVIHNGVLQQVGEPATILRQPANAFVKDFFRGIVSTHQTLAEVVAAGFGQPVTNDDATVLPLTTSIFTWAGMIQDAPATAIVAGDRRLTGADLLKYLASLRTEDRTID